MCTYQRVRHVRFSENLACFVFLKHPFRDSSFCLITVVLKIHNFQGVVSALCYDWFNFFSYFTNNMTFNAVILIVSNILSMAFLVGLPVAGFERFCGVSIRSVPAAVDISVVLNVAAGEGAAIVIGGSK